MNDTTTVVLAEVLSDCSNRLHKLQFKYSDCARSVFTKYADIVVEMHSEFCEAGAVQFNVKNAEKRYVALNMCIELCSGEQRAMSQNCAMTTPRKGLEGAFDVIGADIAFLRLLMREARAEIANQYTPKKKGRKRA